MKTKLENFLDAFIFLHNIYPFMVDEEKGKKIKRIGFSGRG